MTDNRIAAVAIMGPTASGKTAAALKIAGKIPCEIISVDSALVYRGMDIGTAKPSPEELSAVPHHLIDIIDPAESYSAAKFKEDASRLIREISAKGKLPLLVGGTMLYFKALLNGFDELPSASPELRQKILTEAKEKGWPALHGKLSALDPVTAERIKPNDAQRIERALEVIEMTGKPLSSLQTGKTVEPFFKLKSFCLTFADRKVLHERIEKRLRIMLENDAFVDEVKRLKARGDLTPDMPSVRCVGYRQIWEYLDGLTSEKEMTDKCIFATRQLAKRQLTWLRTWPDITAVDAMDPDAAGIILRETENFLAQLKDA